MDPEFSTNSRDASCVQKMKEKAGQVRKERQEILTGLKLNQEQCQEVSSDNWFLLHFQKEKKQE